MHKTEPDVAPEGWSEVMNPVLDLLQSTVESKMGGDCAVVVIAISRESGRQYLGRGNMSDMELVAVLEEIVARRKAAVLRAVLPGVVEAILKAVGDDGATPTPPDGPPPGATLQ